MKKKILKKISKNKKIIKTTQSTLDGQQSHFYQNIPLDIK